MRFPLSKAPEGLLGTLDLKTGGENPSALGTELAPSIECLPFYLLRNRLVIQGAGPWVAVGAAITLAAAAGSTAYFAGTPGSPDFVVPQTETIRIKSIALQNARAAADAALTLELVVFVKRALAALYLPIGSATFGPKPATDLVGTQAVDLTEPLWMGPGDRLRLAASTTQTAAGSNLVLALDCESVPSG